MTIIKLPVLFRRWRRRALLFPVAVRILVKQSHIRIWVRPILHIRLRLIFLLELCFFVFHWEPPRNLLRQCRLCHFHNCFLMFIKRLLPSQSNKSGGDDAPDPCKGHDTAGTSALFFVFAPILRKLLIKGRYFRLLNPTWA